MELREKSEKVLEIRKVPSPRVGAISHFLPSFSLSFSFPPPFPRSLGGGGGGGVDGGGGIPHTHPPRSYRRQCRDFTLHFYDGGGG